MSNLNKLDFNALEVSGRNYNKWTQDIKLHLTAKKLRSTINADNVATESLKASAMIFIRKHMEEALQEEYLAEEDPYTLWVALEERFSHQKTIFLPEARNNWSNIRFQDYKSVSEYNSEIFRIRAMLKFCGEELTESDLLEKTLSTFPSSCIVLQQQYRESNFTRFAELITILLLVEKNNNLLRKNDRSRPLGTRATPFPEANVVGHRDTNRDRRGRGCGQQRRSDNPSRENRVSQKRDRNERNLGPPNTCRFKKTRSGHSGKWNQWNRNENNIGQVRNQHNQDRPTICYRCGGDNHWSRNCSASAQVIEEYHASRRNRQANFVEISNDPMDMETTYFEIVEQRNMT